MKISCDSCGAKYTVSDDKVQGKTVKVKCRKCSAVIVVSSTGHVTTTAGQGAASGGGAEPGGAAYTVAVADGDQRNMTLPEIVAAYNEGVIDAETFVWAEGMDDWQALRDVDAIVDALHHAASQGEPPAAAAAPAGGQEEDLGRTVAMADGGAYGIGPAPVAAASRPAPAAGMSAPAPAAFPTAAARGAGSSPGASSSASLASNISFGAAAAPTAARASKPGNVGGKPTEDSAIFSLNMLTAKVGSGDEPKPNFTEEEDSGLIDLKALAGGLSSDSVLSGPLDVTGGVGGVFPLGAPPPPVAAAPRIEDEPKQGGMSKLLLAGLATAVVGLGAVVVFLVVRGGATPPQQPQVVTVVQTVQVAPPPVETAPTTEASADASSSASAKAGGKGALPKGGTAKGTSTGTGATPPTTGAAPKPKGSPCGCAADDLMCNMRCSNKK